MPFAAAISEHPDVRQAAGEVIGELLERLGAEPDLAVLFVTAPHREALADVASAVRTLLRPGTLIGAAASSVVGGDREVEETAAVVLWAARFGAPVTPLHVDSVRAPKAPCSPGWRPVFDAEPDRPQHLILLADPFSFPADDVRRHGGRTAARPAGHRRAGLGGQWTRAATVSSSTATSSPTAPSGSSSARVGRDDGGVAGLPPDRHADGRHPGRSSGRARAGRPARARAGWPSSSAGSSESERELARSGLHVGRVIDEHKERFERGDFLIRNVLGGNQEAGALVVAGPVEVGATVQFQVRDAATADEDLRQLLAGRQADGRAALHLHRAGLAPVRTDRSRRRRWSTRSPAGPPPGCSAPASSGPVGGRSFVHGFTASVLLFPVIGRRPGWVGF